LFLPLAKEDQPKCESEKSRKARINNNRPDDLLIQFVTAQHPVRDGGKTDTRDHADEPSGEKGSDNIERRRSRATSHGIEATQRTNRYRRSSQKLHESLVLSVL
jgi:hypothetical protein